MGGDNGEDGAPTRAAIPLIAGAIVLAQITMVSLFKVWHWRTLNCIVRKLTRFGDFFLSFNVDRPWPPKLGINSHIWELDEDPSSWLELSHCRYVAH